MLLNEISCCTLNFGACESLKAILTSLPQAFFHTKRKIHVLIDHPQFVNSSNIYELYVQPIGFPNHKLGYSYMITWLHEGQVSTCCNFWINYFFRKRGAVGGNFVPMVLSLPREEERGPCDPIISDIISWSFFYSKDNIVRFIQPFKNLKLFNMANFLSLSFKCLTNHWEFGITLFGNSEQVKLSLICNLYSEKFMWVRS